MARFIFFLIIALAIVAFLKMKARSRSSGHSGHRPAGSGPEVIVACHHCGVHFPQSESIAVDGRHYCCEEHRRLG